MLLFGDTRKTEPVSSVPCATGGTLRRSFALLLLAALHAQPPAGLGEGYMGEYELAARQTLQLAEATPAEKFTWRPAPGVRSISEVYMHVAIGNYGLLSFAGVKPADAPKIAADTEKKVVAKADVIRWLKSSQDAVRAAYPKADKQKLVKFFGKDAPVEHVFLRILNHAHEHMGQAIAYARMNGIAPPWSKE
jgi:uncharacterized damage-inducible protein DinB